VGQIVNLRPIVNRHWFRAYPAPARPVHFHPPVWPPFLSSIDRHEPMMREDAGRPSAVIRCCRAGCPSTLGSPRFGI